MRNLIILFVILTTSISCTKTVNEWSKWRGTNGDAISTETDWDYNKLDSAHILWRKNIGMGHSAISVVGTHFYASGWRDTTSVSDTIAKSSVYCFNVLDGEQVWRFDYPSAKRSYEGPRSTPVLDGDRLYQVSWAGIIYCIDRHTGTEIWNRDLMADSLALIDMWGFSPSPVIIDSILVLNLNESGLALKKMSGDIVWASKAKAANYSSAQLLDYKGKKAAVFSCDTFLNIVDAHTGEVLLQYNKKTDMGIHNDVQFLPDGKIFASNSLLKMEGDSLLEIWRNDTISSVFQTGVVIDGYAYQFAGWNKKGYFCCVDLSSGQPVWSEKFGAWGSVLAVDNKLIILTGLGKVIIADATPEGFHELKSLQVLPRKEKRENFCWTMPVFLEGRLFVRNSNGDMACIDLNK